MKKVIKIDYNKTALILSIVTMIFLFNSCSKSPYEPKIGEVYVVSVNKKSFTTWKITNIDNSKIWYVVNDYNVSEKYLIESINHDENYTDTPKSITRNEFIKLPNKNLIETPKK